MECLDGPQLLNSDLSEPMGWPIPKPKHHKDLLRYFQLSNSVHGKIELWSQVYFLALYFLVFCFLIVQKHRIPCFIVAVSLLLVHGILAVFYAVSLYDFAENRDSHLQDWLRKDHREANNFLCWLCHMGYGLGYFILVIR